MADDKVGYGRPPKSGRFRPGVSGNPRGRPKRRPTPIAELINDALSAPIEIRRDGRMRIVTELEVTLEMLVKKAVSGDIGAITKTLAILERGGATPPAAPIVIENMLPDPLGHPSAQAPLEGEASASAPTAGRLSSDA